MVKPQVNTNYGIMEDKGLPNEVEILVRDASEGLRVINVDTGEDVEPVRGGDGWRFTDVIGPAWYGLYGVMPDGGEWKGPGPLPEGPQVSGLEATFDEKAGGVRLDWKPCCEDWAGCNVERYRIYRGEAGADPELLADIHGRILRGPGGLVTSYLDKTAEPGRAYVYQVSTVTALRRNGPTAAVPAP